LQPARTGRVLMGASMGAVASLHAAWRHPAAYGGLLLQSGSFARDESLHAWGAKTFGSVASFVNRFSAAPAHTADSVYVSCGIYESLIEDNRVLLPALRQSSSELLYEEAPDGHHWENWRDRMRSALTWLFADRPRRAQR
jgi:enterochelin esterase family protein